MMDEDRPSNLLLADMAASPRAPSRQQLFISYSRKNKAQVFAFAEALAKAGVITWIDREEINLLDDFPARIRDGLGRSCALLAWYSHEYRQSSYCQKELTAAWVCAQRMTRDVLSRILIVNPEADVAHIALGEVGRQNYLPAPSDAGSLSAAVALIREKVGELRGDFSRARDLHAPEWLPSAQPGSARYVGRLTELWRIHTHLNPVGITAAEDPHRLVQLVGLGGVGKTLLAVEYAKRFGAAYPVGVYWLRAYGFTSDRPLSAELREQERRMQVQDLAIRHDIEIKGRDFPEIYGALARNLASRQEPYLWIVDDLPAGLDQAQTFPSWCAPSSNGRTLISTRSRDYAGIGGTVEVEALEPESALKLLTDKRKPQTDEEDAEARALVEELGRHALAVDVAGHFLLTTQGFSQLRHTLASLHSDVLGELVTRLRGQLPGGHEKSIVSTLLISIRLLGEEGRALLRLTCELQGATPIPLSFAEATLARAFDLSMPAAQETLMRAVNQLDINSLARVSASGSVSDVLTVHVLVRYTMLRADPAGERAAGLRARLHEAAVRAIVELHAGVVADIRRHADIETEVIHAQHLATDPESADEARLVLWLSDFEAARGNYRVARDASEKALQLLARILGPDHLDTLASRSRVARWTGEAGDGGRALELFGGLLPDQVRVLGANHPETFITRHNIVYWTGETGDVPQALGLAEQLLPDQIRVLGADHPVTLTTRNNLAAWTGITGDLRTALQLSQQLLPDQIRVLGADHPDTLRTRNNIAAFTGRTGEPRKALHLGQQLLDDQVRVLGADHPSTLVTRGNIAAWTGVAGDPSAALRLYQQLLSEQVRVLGADHPGTLATRANIAGRTGETGDSDQALRLYLDLLPDQTRVLGPDHPETLKTRNNIAASTDQTGDARVALRQLQQLLPDELRVLGAKHPDTIATRANIASLTGRTGDKDEALRLYHGLLPDMERALGSDHQQTRTIRAEIAALTGDARGAIWSRLRGRLRTWLRRR